jgi:hypothetical protein
MIRSAEKLRKLTAILDKDNNEQITEALNQLREEKPFEGAIFLLTSFYNNTNDNPIRKIISGFMNDLKDQSATEEVIIEIRKQWKPETISMLISSCWQSGLNYSGYSADLAKAFVNGDYVTAIECLTVIQESIDELSREKKDEILRIIEENPLSPTDDKTALVAELLSMLC